MSNLMNPNHRDEHIRNLYRQLFYLWGFLGQEGLWEEACEFVREHQHNPTPFEFKTEEDDIALSGMLFGLER